MTFRPSRTKAREALYARECEKARAEGLGDYPICNLCGTPVLPGRLWDESHDPAKPRAWGGTETAVAHRKCNRQHGARVVTPMVAKAKRQRRMHLDIFRSTTPLPGGREDRVKKTMSGKVVDRSTGQPWGSR
jgi:hypothetical protein